MVRPLRSPGGARAGDVSPATSARAGDPSGIGAGRIGTGDLVILRDRARRAGTVR